VPYLYQSIYFSDDNRAPILGVGQGGVRLTGIVLAEMRPSAVVHLAAEVATRSDSYRFFDVRLLNRVAISKKRLAASQIHVDEQRLLLLQVFQL
jgi:hypothetical protein